MSQEKLKKRKVYLSPPENANRGYKARDLLAPELREAQNIEASDPERAAEIRKAFWERVEVTQEAARRDDEDKKNRVGKYDPENIALGGCMICGGDVVERLKWKSHGEMRFGGPSNTHRVHDCFYCKECGITYAHTKRLLPLTKET